MNYLILSIVLSSILSFFLLLLDPIFGIAIASGIVFGCIFRFLYLISDIHKIVTEKFPKESPVQKALREHLEERDK